MPPIDVPATIQIVASFLFSIIVLLLPFIIKNLFPEIAAWLKAHSTAAQWSIVTSVAQAVVQNAEQLKKLGVLPSNDVALRWACNKLYALLFARGISLPMDELATAIESAVNELPHSAPAPTFIPLAPAPMTAGVVSAPKA